MNKKYMVVSKNAPVAWKSTYKRPYQRTNKKKMIFERKKKKKAEGISYRNMFSQIKKKYAYFARPFKQKQI